jgi:hypothetical protein
MTTAVIRRVTMMITIGIASAITATIVATQMIATVRVVLYAYVVMIDS